MLGHVGTSCPCPPSPNSFASFHLSHPMFPVSIQSSSLSTYREVECQLRSLTLHACEETSLLIRSQSVSQRGGIDQRHQRCKSPKHLHLVLLMILRSRQSSLGSNPPCSLAVDSTCRLNFQASKVFNQFDTDQTDDYFRLREGSNQRNREVMSSSRELQRFKVTEDVEVSIMFLAGMARAVISPRQKRHPISNPHQTAPPKLPTPHRPFHPNHNSQNSSDHRLLNFRSISITCENFKR